MSSDPVLSEEEFAGLKAIDGSWFQQRPSIEVEIVLRKLGLIQRDGLAGMPFRTSLGDEFVLRPRVA
jgi:hypothetical protein